MRNTLAFDVYGTVIDTAGVYRTLQKNVGPEARAFMEVWRNKQLEYSFRRAAMNAYVDFSIVTKQALEYCCLLFNINLNAKEVQELMNAYKVLPAFDEVEVALESLPRENFAKYAFSNGSAQAVSTLLENANIATLFNGVVSVEKTKMFKPDPIVYQHFNESTASKKEHTYLISGNPFDVLGALSYGMKAIWVQRSPNAVFDPWGLEPTAVISNLAELKEVL